MRSSRFRPRAMAAAAAALAVVSGCSGGSARGSAGATASPSGTTAGAASPAAAGSTAASGEAVTSSGHSALLPGMPAPLSPTDVWAADRPGALAPSLRHVRPMVYVPNSQSDTVSVIDPATAKVVRTVRVGREPQHVVPSWDLKTLWVNNDLGNSLTPITGSTGRFHRPVRVDDPYNLYFTPNGRYAVVMASARRELVFRDPHTMAVRKVVHVPCAGVNHADFSADGRYFIVSCEFSGQMLKVDTERMSVLHVLRLPTRPGHMAPKPQDVKLSPDGKVFYVADMMSDGIWLMDGPRFKVTGFIATGKGAHGLYVTRDSKYLLITNRDEGTISVLDFRTRRLVHKWRLPRGASPDMGNLSVDGTVFWVSGRYSGAVYAVSTVTGKTLHVIKVGAGPHGLCVWPQPGRYSLGHTGVMR